MKFGLLIIAFLFSSCSMRTDIPLEFPTPPPPPTATPLPKLELKRDAELEKKFAEIAKEARGKVGVAAVVLETGDAALLNADDHYAMQSVYKLPISMAVMDQVRQDKLDLDEQIGVTKEDFVLPGQVSPLRDKNPNGGVFTIRELIRLALVESDGSASDVLMRVVGGPSVVQDYLTQIGINDMKIVNSEKEFARDWNNQYQNWTTPVAAVELLRWLDKDANGWRPPDLDQDLSESQQILQFMMESTTGPKRIKGLLPLLGPFKIVAHKTGTSGNRSGITAATNDIGIMYLGDNKPRVAIAVFVADSPANDQTRDSVIARIAKATWDKWATSDKQSDKATLDDFMIKGVKLGDEEEQVVAKVGKPTKRSVSTIDFCGETEQTLLKYDGFTVQLTTGGEQKPNALEIWVNSQKVDLPYGLHIGDTKSVVVQKLGAAEANERGIYYFLKTGDNLQLDFNRERLKKVRVFINPC